MNKKHLMVVIFLISFLGTILYVFNIRITPIDNTNLNFYTSYDDEIYHIEGTSEQVMYRMNSQGKVIKKIKLNSSEKLKEIVYNDFVVDKNKNIYFLATEKDLKTNSSNDCIKVYKSYDKVFENLYIADSGERIDNLGYDDGVVSVFLFNSEKNRELKLIKYDTLSQKLSEVTYEFSNTDNIKKAVYSSKGYIYYLNEQAQLYLIDDNNIHNKIDLNFKDREKIIPCIDTGISVDEKGNLYFTDGYNFEFYKYDKELQEVQRVYERGQRVSGDIRFKDIRCLNYNGSKLTAISPSIFKAAFGEEEAFYFSLNENGEETILKSMTLNTAELIKKGIVVFISILFLSGFAAALIYLIIYAVKSLRSLLIKQIIIIIPLTVIISLVILYSLNNRIFKVIENEAYSQLYIMVSSAIKNIDVEEFKSVEFPQSKDSEYYKKINETINLSTEEFKTIFPDAIEKDLYYSMYFIKDGYSYLALENTGYEEEKQQDGLREEIFASIDDEWYRFKDVKNHTLVNTDGEDDWFYYARIITDNQNNIVGYLEIGMDKYSFEKEAQKICAEVSIFVITLIIITMVLILFSLKKSLESLRTLKKGVVALIDGEWTATVDINTNDEIEDIGNSFNKMSYRISRYLNSIVKLNEAYEKFVPNRLFKLLGKENVLSVELGNQAVRNMSIMSVSIKNLREANLAMSEKFEFMNKILGNVVTIINKSDGIVEQFKGNGLRAIYTKEVDDVIDAGLKVVEKFDSEYGGYIPAINIQNEAAVLGVVGNEESLDITVVSNSENFVYLLDKFIQKNKLRLVITGDVYDKVNNKEKYNFRYIGKFTDNQTYEKMLDIYDVSDSYNLEIKNNRIITKEKFEKGVNNYISGNLLQARKEFVDVIRIDSSDEVAKMYLFLCDKYIQTPLEQWKGSINI